ncbi:MAG TPA: MBL fold metallo-hydrolase [Methanosarcinales archaeon]|nr:MBL fold metallo-hydrolase [Methanosarcinales archaeon]
MKITTAYDNNIHVKGLKSAWGFSCAIDVSGEDILFDTGGNGSVLLYNMERLDIDPEDIGKIVLSHEHWDHAGGLIDLLETNNHAEIYLLASFSESFKRRIKNPVIEIYGPSKICDQVYTTGELGTSIKEQSLITETEKGLIVATGCAHPGLRAIMDCASGFGEIYGIIGGFHGFDEYPLLEGLKLLSPCHCTQHLREIASRFPNAYQKNGVGRVFTFE